MKNRFKLGCLLTIMAVSIVFYACPDAGMTGEIDNPFTNNGSTLKWNVNPSRDGDTGVYTQNRVLNTVWYEPEEDPRQVIGYQLTNGIPYFDHMVFLYAIRIIQQNCGTNPGAGVAGEDSTCRRNGLHGCFMKNQQYYQENWETYFKPLRDRGIKTIMSIVPAGGHSIQGVSTGTLYRWEPSNSANSWQNLMGDPNAVYFANEAATSTFIAQMKEYKEQFLIDGFGFDEEYSGTITGTNGTNSVVSLYNSTAGGQNILRFMHDMNLACYGPDYDNFDMEHFRNSSNRTNRLIFENYEISFGGNIPVSYTLPNTHPDPTQRGKVIHRDNLLDISFHAFYGSWAPNSGLPNFPRNRYGPASTAITDTRQTAPKPPPGVFGGSGVVPRMTSHLAGNYGVNMYYCLRSRTDIREGDLFGNPPWPINLYGADNRPETYLSEASKILFGMKTVFVGRDYRRVHEFQ